MNQESISKRLHFHVRHDNYDQTIGYGYFLDHALSRLNREHPKSAKALLERAAMLLLNPRDEKHLAARPDDQQKNGDVFAECLPDTLKSRLKIRDGSFFDPNTQLGIKNTRTYFGPAAQPLFGLFAPRRVKYKYNLAHGGVMTPDRGRVTAKSYGDANVTHVATKDEAYRAYFDVLSEHYGIRLDSIPADFKLEFDYPIPKFFGREEKLPLMKIGSPKILEQEFRSRFGGDQETIENYLVAPFLGEYYMRSDGVKIAFPEKDRFNLVFLHPSCDEKYFAALTKCIEPLFKQLDAKPKQLVVPGAPLPEEKRDAIATIYWLVAQSTPIIRGGSAYANVILEHMAQRLREQGYDYEIPYTKEGVDLWAHAATLPLEDKDGLKGFKARFKEGVFFDTHAQDEDVERYLNAKLQRTDAGRAAFVDQTQQKEKGPTQKGE